MKINIIIYSIFRIFIVVSLYVSYVSDTSVRKNRIINNKIKDVFQKDDDTKVQDPQVGSIEDPIDLEVGSVELTNMVDPYSGSYKNKVTISKNFSGKLVFSGINLSSLKQQGKIVYIRIKFGRTLESKIFQGVMARASGLTSESTIDAVIVDLYQKDLSNIKLSYDLFDYKDYSVENSLIENPIDKNLYCRGLDLKYDSTFIPTFDDQNCNYSGAKCLYTYAKIYDSLLYSSGVTSVPSLMQIDYSNNHFFSDSNSNTLKKCLPDNNDSTNLELLLNLTPGSLYGLSYNGPVTLGGSVYTYRGPFRSNDRSAWGISDDALFGSYGLFKKSLSNDLDPDKGFESLMYPRVTKIDQRANVEHLSSGEMFSSRSIHSLTSNGMSEYMDGCNARVSRPSISQCNVNATIELFTYDSLNKPIVHASTSDLKIQLIDDYQGPTAMKTCISDAACGSEECCYNQKCWGKELVGGVCRSELGVDGNLQTGEICNNDLQCSSLCCNDETKTCNNHSSTGDGSALCGKTYGQTCVTREFCQEVTVKNCLVVKTEVSLQGDQLCALKCYNKPTLPDCRNGRCVAPPIPEIPNFDENNPDCSVAVEPPVY